MPVFDFNDVSDERNHAECTYTTFRSDAGEATPEQPIFLLDNHSRKWKHHSIGVFTNPVKRSSFEFEEEDGKFSADILEIDARFVSLYAGLARITSMCVCPVRIGRMDMLFIRFVRLHLAAAPSYPQRMDFCSL